MRAPIPYNSDVCNISKEVRIEHKLHIHNIVYKWNYAVQSCVWAKLYVGSEACMLAFGSCWTCAITRSNINASHDATLVVENTVYQVEKRVSRIAKLLVRGFQRR